MYNDPSASVHLYFIRFCLTCQFYGALSPLSCSSFVFDFFLTGKFHDFHFYILSPEFRFFSEFLICSSLMREIARGGLLTSVVGEKRGLIMCFWLFLGCAKNKTKQVAGFFQANRLITVYSNCKSSKLKMRD